MSSHKSAATYVDDQICRKRKKREQENSKRKPKPVTRFISALSSTSIESSVTDITEDCFDPRSSSTDFQTTCSRQTPKSSIESFLQADIISTNHEESQSDIELATDDCSSTSTFSNVSNNDVEDQINDLLNDPSFNSDTRPLHPSTKHTVRDFSIDLLEFFRDARLPENQRRRLLLLFEKYMPSLSNVPKSTEFLMNSVGVSQFHRTEKLCNRCCSLVQTDRCTNVTCMNSKISCINKDSVVEVVTFNIEEQIRLLYQKHSSLLRQYQSEARRQSTIDQEDIVSGEVYQTLLSSNGDFFLSIMLHSDGIPLYRSRTCSAWPILGAVIELPPYCRNRCDNILLLSVWIGKEKPNFDVILSKLSSQLSQLKETGVKINNSKEIRLYLPMLMGDMPALSDMVKFVLPNAYYACMFCKTKGVYSHEAHCILYPSHMKAELRSKLDFDQGAQTSNKNSHASREKMAGIKGISSFKQFLDVPLPHSLVIDAMHTVYLCHAKKLLCHFQTLLSKQNLQLISSTMCSLLYIHDVLRRPRAFGNVERWKASEIRVYILYLALPLLVEHLPAEESSWLAVYTVILRLLHDEWHNDPQRVTAVSSLIDRYVSNLTTKVEQNVCPSKLLTISTHTHYHLPVQCRKFGRLDWLQNFVFEGFLGYVKNFVKGPHGAGEQIAFGFTMNFILSKLEKNNLPLGHFQINDHTFGSNVINVEKHLVLRKFVADKNYSGKKIVFFSRLHRFNTTFHSFLFARKGQTCSYLVSYNKGDTTQYGFILCFVLFDKTCYCVLHKLTQSDFSIASFISDQPYVLSIKSILDKLFIFSPKTTPNLTSSCDFDLCDVKFLEFRCFSVPMQIELMCLIPYPCAYAHN